MTAERQTSDARRASRLVFACALGSFAGTRLSGGRGLRCAVLRLRLHRLGTAAAASAVSRFRWFFGGVGDLFERGTALRRPPPGQHIALQPRVVPAGRLQRALGDGALDALALKARIELIDAPFGLGAIGSGVDLDFGDAVGQRLYLLFGVGKRGLARLQRVRQDARSFRQRRPRLFELAGLGVEPIARDGEPLDNLFRGVACDARFHRLALQHPDVLGARGKRLAHLGEQFLRGGGARTQRLEPQVHRIGFGLMALVGLIARGRQRDTLVLGGSQADVHLLQPRPRGGQAIFALGEATRQARRLRQRLIECRLQRALVVLQQQELFPYERAFGLQFDNALIGAVCVIDGMWLASLRARPLAVSCANWLSRLATSARTATISLLSSVLSPSSPRAACCASVNSRPNSSPTLSNSAARFSSALNSLRT